MANSDLWLVCRTAFLETGRALAVGCGADSSELGWFLAEWRSFTVVEVDQPLVEAALELAIEHGLRSLDSLQLAGAALGGHATVCATFDRRLWNAAAALGLTTLPQQSPA